MGLKHQKLQHNNSEWKILIFDVQNRAESSDYNKRKASNTQKLSKYRVWHLITEKYFLMYKIHGTSYTSESMSAIFPSVCP